MSCPASLYPINADLYVGKSTDGKPVQFKGIPAYREFLAKMSLTGHPCPDVSMSITPVTLKEPVTPFAKFMEFQPANPRQQSMYSAMSSGWVGSDETNTAFEGGLNTSLSR
jgi:hypothetical protein